MIPVIAIDGPAASGKTSLALILARRLSYHLLISGALYRSAAYLAQNSNHGLHNKKLFLAEIQSAEISFHPDGQELQVLLNQHDVSAAIRSETCAELASRLSAMADVRLALIARQRSFRVLPGLLAEGRDMGSVVFPEAKLKIYLTADAAMRARRRYQQLRQSGISVTMKEVYQQIVERDERDKSRSISPLKPAANAVLIDNTQQPIEKTIDEVLELKKAIYG